MPDIVYVYDFPDEKGKFGSDTIVIKAKNVKQAEQVIKYYFFDWKEKLKANKRFCTTLMEILPKNRLRKRSKCASTL